MDLATILGLILCGILVSFGIVFEQENMILDFSNLVSFIDVPSMLITFGGAFMCVLMTCKSLREFFFKLRSARLVVSNFEKTEVEIINRIIQLSNVARKEGLLALEDYANQIEDEYMSKGLLLIVDGTDPELVSDIMKTEIFALDERHKDNISFWENLAALGPAWGMIGTLIGLINMLGKLSDVNTVGPNMAIALITTLYGSLLANWIAIPIATKLKAHNKAEMLSREIMLEGILSIQAGENPRVIEEKLKSFMSPKERLQINKKSYENNVVSEDE